MARVPEIVPHELSPAQRRVYDMIVAGPRGKVEGPLRVWLASPELAERAQALGAYCRYTSTLPPRLSELAILVVGAHWKAGFEFSTHAPIAIAAGLAPDVVESLRHHCAPALGDRDEALIYTFTTELLADKRVGASTYDQAVKRFGLTGVVDLIGILGYYSLICMTIVAFEVADPGGLPDPFDNIPAARKGRI